MSPIHPLFAHLSAPHNVTCLSVPHNITCPSPLMLLAVSPNAALDLVVPTLGQMVSNLGQVVPHLGQVVQNSG